MKFEDLKELGSESAVKVIFNSVVVGHSFRCNFSGNLSLLISLCVIIGHLMNLSLAQASGKYRQEGKTYVVQDGDIIFFKFNVSGGGKK